jgi:hypothetical protein
MELQTREGLRLDVCRSCKGVWFDRTELAEIWKLSAAESVATRPRTREGLGDAAGDLLLFDALMYTPDLFILGAHSAGYVVTETAEAVSAIPEVAGGVIEGAGEAAASVFEVVLGIIEGLFS